MRPDRLVPVLRLRRAAERQEAQGLAALRAAERIAEMAAVGCALRLASAVGDAPGLAALNAYGAWLPRGHAALAAARTNHAAHAAEAAAARDRLTGRRAEAEALATVIDHRAEAARRRAERGNRAAHLQALIVARCADRA